MRQFINWFKRPNATPHKFIAGSKSTWIIRITSDIDNMAIDKVRLKNKAP